jgi:hypothetical protein
MTMKIKQINILTITIFAIVTALLCGCKNVSTSTRSDFSRFTGLENFSNFEHSTNANGESVLLSPVIKSHIEWNELIVSWNATAPNGTYLKIDARPISSGRTSKFYQLGNWSPDGKIIARTSVRGQKDATGDVDTDTLVLNQAATAAQIRVTLGGINGQMPALKFLGLSFANTKIPTTLWQPNHAAWGKIIATPEHSQHGYANEKGWCSPTSLSMALSRWAEVLNRPEMNLTVPEVAAKVYDSDFDGTGNWPFNTAFAGSFAGMRSYVTRLDDISEVEDWIAAGIPVILSARWDWLQPGRPPDSVGHLIVCIGFTENGDVVINDPAAHLERGDAVRHTYKREDVIHSWTKSHNAVYLVYPIGETIPADKYWHWEN